MRNIKEWLQQPNEDFMDWKIRLIVNKIDRIYDIDWVEMRDLLELDCSSDHLRKVSYGIYEIYKYYLTKENKEDKSQLDLVKSKIGEYDIKKQITQTKINELSKIKREFIKSFAIAEDLKNYFEDNFVINIPEYCSNPLEINGEYEMILHLADFHVGYIINDCKGNYYNWEIANQRINKLLDECIKYIKLYDIKKIFVIGTGDEIEHASMRLNQSQFCEFNQAEQINKAIELIYRILVTLCQYCDVEYDSIYGNHDRMNGDKKANLDGDNADTIISEQLKVYKALSKNNRLTITDRKHSDKEIYKIIKGFKCKFVHGDNIKTEDGKSAIKAEMSLDNIFYDLLFKAHKHNFKLESENHGRYIISTGCLSGFNDFSTNFKCATEASQTIVILKENEIELIKDVILK